MERLIYKWQAANFFAPIRDKSDYARVLAFGIKLLLIPEKLHEKPPVAKMKLKIDRMSRLFFYQASKFFSISFPFTVSEPLGNPIEVYSYSGRIIDHKITSDIIAITGNENFRMNQSFIEFSTTPYEDYSFDTLMVIEEIFRHEPGYVRYDVDPKNENGKLHPLIHFDFNYSQYSTFKLGSTKAVTENDFENMLNVKTDCYQIIK